MTQSISSPKNKYKMGVPIITLLVNILGETWENAEGMLIIRK